MLTELECRNATCPPDKARARYPDSQGLYLEVSPAGSRRWFWKYRFQGKEGRMALGPYPAVSLKAARLARETAKADRAASNADPVALRRARQNKPAPSAAETFKNVALVWFSKAAPTWSENHAARSKRQLERDLFPLLGERPIAEIGPSELLSTLRKVEERGAVETADRGLMLCRQIWAYANSEELVQRDITTHVKAGLSKYRGRHFAAITDPAQLGELLRAIDAYKGGVIVRAALKLAPLLFQRPGELRGARWDELNLTGALWTITPGRMKRRKEGKEHGDPHLVPLSRQAVEIFTELKGYTGRGAMVFPGERSHERPMSENSVRTALLSMGYTPDLQTWHGFRATARTMLAERLDFDPLVIEAQLAHAVKDANGRAYNRTQYMRHRHKMMQEWADYLDRLRTGELADSVRQPGADAGP